MKRRNIIMGFALSVTVAGCLDRVSDGSSSTEESNDDDGASKEDGDPKASNDNKNSAENQDVEYSTRYRILVESPVEEVEADDICRFEELPSGAQTEFLQAIDGVDFESEDHSRYGVDESPELLDTDCYSGYIEFEDKYYWIGVEVDSG
ncbi:hypothetical protein [Natrialba chahannaoensis]|uniref:hypothetical protein n=1 Tax=Natrialba chahannaoensis TaxID=68911 RepID=UPI00126884DB|nr:hypothetical protein [Natrialba chahannaoensis]